MDATVDDVDMALITRLLHRRIESSHASGLEVTIFDPDLDESGALASALSETLLAGLA
jgi:hypothetical protein